MFFFSSPRQQRQRGDEELLLCSNGGGGNDRYRPRPEDRVEFLTLRLERVEGLFMSSATAHRARLTVRITCDGRLLAHSTHSHPLQCSNNKVPDCHHNNNNNNNNTPRPLPSLSWNPRKRRRLFERKCYTATWGTENSNHHNKKNHKNHHGTNNTTKPHAANELRIPLPTRSRAHSYSGLDYDYDDQTWTRTSSRSTRSSYSSSYSSSYEEWSHVWIQFSIGLKLPSGSTVVIGSCECHVMELIQSSVSSGPLDKVVVSLPLQAESNSKVRLAPAKARLQFQLSESPLWHLQNRAMSTNDDYDDEEDEESALGRMAGCSSWGGGGVGCSPWGGGVGRCHADDERVVTRNNPDEVPSSGCGTGIAVTSTSVLDSVVGVFEASTNLLC